MKHYKLFTLLFALTLPAMLSVPASGLILPEQALAAGFIYVDGSLSSNCTGNYAIAGRNCSGSDGADYRVGA